MKQTQANRKLIKAYLESRKDVYMAMWAAELQKEDVNMATVEWYNKLHNCFAYDLQLFKEQKIN